VAGLLRPDDRALYLASGTVLVLLAGYGFWWWTRGPRAR